MAPRLGLDFSSFAMRRSPVRIPSRPPDSKQLNRLFGIPKSCHQSTIVPQRMRNRSCPEPRFHSHVCRGRPRPRHGLRFWVTRYSRDPCCPAQSPAVRLRAAYGWNACCGSSENSLYRAERADCLPEGYGIRQKPSGSGLRKSLRKGSRLS